MSCLTRAERRDVRRAAFKRSPQHVRIYVAALLASSLSVIIASYVLDLLPPDWQWRTAFITFAAFMSTYLVVRAVLTPPIRQELLSRGLCPRCGYYLRATPERCPECALATENTENTEN